MCVKGRRCEMWVGRMGMGEECYERLYHISKGMPKKNMTTSVIWGFFPIVLFSAFSRWRQVSII